VEKKGNNNNNSQNFFFFFSKIFVVVIVEKNLEMRDLTLEILTAVQTRKVFSLFFRGNFIE
jgi:hypothetical protein